MWNFSHFCIPQGPSCPECWCHQSPWAGACLRAWIRCGSRRSWAKTDHRRGYTPRRPVRTHQIPLMSQMIKHTFNHKIFASQSYFSVFLPNPSSPCLSFHMLEKQKWKIYIIREIHNNKKSVFLPDCTTSSRVEPKPVLRFLSLSRISRVRYFFSRDLLLDSCSLVKPASSFSMTAASTIFLRVNLDSVCQKRRKCLIFKPYRPRFSGGNLPWDETCVAMLNTGHRVTMIRDDPILVDSVPRGRCPFFADVRNAGEPIPFAGSGEKRHLRKKKWQPCCARDMLLPSHDGKKFLAIEFNATNLYVTPSADMLPL